MRRRHFVAAALAAAALPGCSRRRVIPPPTDARRIVSVSPATTEALFAVGAAGRAVGRSRFCDFPPEAARLPIVGGFVDVDVEAVLELNPDLVVGAPGPTAARLTERLAQRGIATWFPGVDSVSAIEAMIVGVGARTAHASDAQRVADAVELHALAVERSVAREAQPRVLMILGTTPLVGVGPKSFLDELLRRARSVNTLGEGGPWQTMGMERVIEMDPDVIVDASAKTASASRIQPDAPGWGGVRAVRERRVVALSDSRVLRPGPRVAEGLSLLAAAIHPGAPASDW